MNGPASAHVFAGGDPALGLDYDSFAMLNTEYPAGFRFFDFRVYFGRSPSLFPDNALPPVAALNGLTGEFELLADTTGFVRGPNCEEDCYEVVLYGTSRIVDSPPPVPEPATVTLLGLGLAATAWRARRRRSRADLAR
jgi:hypothetical protein